MGEGAVWVNGPDNVTRIEPDTNSSATIDVRHRLGGIAAGEGGVWTADSREGVLWRIDPVREAPVRTINVGAGSLGVAAGAGSVWVANSIDGTVSRIDPVTSEVVKTIEVGGTPRGVAVGEGFVWVRSAETQGYAGVSRSWRGRSRSSASEPAPATRQTTAASGQSARGSAPRTKAPTAGPMMKPTSHEMVETAM